LDFKEFYTLEEVCEGSWGLFCQWFTVAYTLLFGLILVYHCFFFLPKSFVSLTISTNFKEVLDTYFSSKLGMPYVVRSTFLVAIYQFQACLISTKIAPNTKSQSFGGFCEACYAGTA
jgi:urea transporter